MSNGQHVCAARRHEIGGIVTEVGPKVTKFKVGDRAGVGCLVNSCRTCEACKEQKEASACSHSGQWEQVAKGAGRGGGMLG